MDQTGDAGADHRQTEAARRLEMLSVASPTERGCSKYAVHHDVDRKGAVLNRDRLGLGVTVMVAIRTAQHTDDWLQAFAGVSRAFRRLSNSIG